MVVEDCKCAGKTSSLLISEGGLRCLNRSVAIGERRGGGVGQCLSGVLTFE